MNRFDESEITRHLTCLTFDWAIGWRQGAWRLPNVLNSGSVGLSVGCSTGSKQVLHVSYSYSRLLLSRWRICGNLENTNGFRYPVFISSKRTMFAWCSNLEGRIGVIFVTDPIVRVFCQVAMLTVIQKQLPTVSSASPCFFLPNWLPLVPDSVFGRTRDKKSS